MPSAEHILRDLATRRPDLGRFTHDTPVLPDVWLAFLDQQRVDVLLTPEADVDPAQLAYALYIRLAQEPETRISHTTRYVVASLTIEELIRIAIPLSAWGRRLRRLVDKPATPDFQRDETFAEALFRPRGQQGREKLSSNDEAAEALWLSRLVTGILQMRELRADGVDDIDPDELQISDAGWRHNIAMSLIVQALTDPEPDRALLRRVTRNRPAFTASSAARATVKADAAVRLFDLECSNLAWAIIDTGIDARHIAFRTRTEKGPRYKRWRARDTFRSRIVKTYDLTRLRDAHSHALYGTVPRDAPTKRILASAEHREDLNAVGQNLLRQRPLDWARIAPLLEITATEYEPPSDNHGTHVASIMAGDWDAATDDEQPVGLCPGLQLYDLRVFDSAGKSDEFTISAALQFVDYLNGYGRAINIAGANVSLSVPYDFKVFGCGQTPVCIEADRLVDGGVVVVAAAGNRGTEHYVQDGELIDGFRMISLTDPGNAENVITVGSTHASDPYAYGISHFSSRGPTGDGRAKPDLVAPGERINAAAIGDNEILTLDGTSQAAAYVSGVSALLLARHRELIGEPSRVKAILTKTASDLGRTREFQGSGLVDALRAIQSV